MVTGQFHLDVSNYKEGRSRADRTEVTAKAKNVAAAVPHDRWFREQVTKAIAKDERGEVTWHDHDAMWDELETQATALVVAKGKKAEAPTAKPARRTSTPGRRKHSA